MNENLRKFRNSLLGRAVINMGQGLIMASIMVGSERFINWLLGWPIDQDSPAWVLLSTVSTISLVGCAALITIASALEVTLVTIVSLFRSFRRAVNGKGEDE